MKSASSKSYVSSRMMEAYAQKRQERKQDQGKSAQMEMIPEEAPENKKVFVEEKEEEPKMME